MTNKTQTTFFSALVAAAFLDVAPTRCGDDTGRPLPPPEPADTESDDAGDTNVGTDPK